MLPNLLARILRLIDPKTLVFVAALLAAIGLVSGYVEVHEQADRTLALRQGPPPRVALQDFDVAKSVGPADEVNVLAEADFTRAAVLAAQGTAEDDRALVVPLFALSDTGAAQVAARDDGAGALTAQVARRAGIRNDVAAPAIGMMFFPLDDGPVPEPAALADAVFGPGANGMVVELNGLHTEPGDYALMAYGAFSVLGVELQSSYLAVRPFAGERLAILGAMSPSQTHRALFLTAMVLVAISALVSIARGRLEEALGAAVEEDEVGPEGPSAAHPKFAPIPSQREIIEAEKARLAEPVEPHWAVTLAGAVLRGVWAGAVAVGGALARSIRSRLARREDEAL